MLVDLSGRRLSSDDGGWYGLMIIDASNAEQHRGLQEIAAMVRAGALAPDTPVIVGTKRMDAPYPDVVVANPTDEASARAVMAGDPSVLADLLEGLEETLEDFLAQVKANKVI